MNSFFWAFRWTSGLCPDVLNTKVLGTMKIGRESSPPFKEEDTRAGYENSQQRRASCLTFRRNFPVLNVSAYLNSPARFGPWPMKYAPCEPRLAFWSAPVTSSQPDGSSWLLIFTIVMLSMSRRSWGSTRLISII
jgi:hypothetical protein